jgi:hypothetical protein
MLIIAVILSLGLWACSASHHELRKSDSPQQAVNVIVLMPVENKTKDERLPRLLSTRLIQELRFKGYAQPVIGNDTMVAFPGNPPKTDQEGNKILPTDKAMMEGADAALYCTLQEGKSTRAFFYVPATVSVRCELRSVKTGETIWNAQHRSTSRNFDVINSTLKSHGALESALEEAVGKVMETLPYGPMLRG